MDFDSFDNYKVIRRIGVGAMGSVYEVAAKFGIPRNSVSQIKTRVERMISAIEAEFQT